MLNNVTLQGRLAGTPELKSTPSGVYVTAFRLAVQRSYVKKGEDRQTDFFDIVAWRKTAEYVCRYFSKGSMMIVNGSLQTREHVDREGKSRRICEVVANEVFYTDKKERSDDEYIYIGEIDGFQEEIA